MNEADPCFLFSDGAFHQACVRQHPQGHEALRRLQQWSLNVGPGKRRCAVCQKEVTDPGDYLLIEHLSSRPSDPLAAFNYTHLHQSCLPKWSNRLQLIELIRQEMNAGTWKGPYLSQLRQALEI
jgi:hypothetical protein